MASHVFRGMAAGMLAGLAASWVMNEFQQLRPQRQPEPRPEGGRPRREPQQEAHQREPQQEDHGQSSEEEEDATVKTARKISQRVLHRDLSECEKQIAGPAVHYAYGSLVGAVYGGLSELLPITSAGLGLPFGAALWLLGDEVAVPALGLGKSPTEYPPEVHADALSSHLMYGLTTDVVRRFLRHVV